MLNQSFRSLAPAYIILATAFLSILAAAVETDIFLPSMPGMQEYFGTTAARIQMMISLNCLGLCVSGVIFGPLSDAYGRRRLLLVGLAIFSAGGIGCVYAETIHQLLFWRFIQGLGASACFIIPSTIIYDLFDKNKAAQILGYYNSALTIMMAGCPMLGAYLYLNHGWQHNFYFMMILTALTWLLTFIFLKETLSQEKRVPLDIKNIIHGYRLLLTNKVSLLNLLIICATFSALFVYIANQSLIFIDYLNVPEHVFPFYQGAGLLFFSIVSLRVGWAINTFGADKVRNYGKGLCCFGAAMLMFAAIIDPTNPVLLTIAMCFFSIGLALFINLIFGDYMLVFPDIKGISSSLITTVRLAATAATIGLSGLLFTGSIRPVAILVFVLTYLSLLCLFALRRHEKAEAISELPEEA